MSNPALENVARLAAWNRRDLCPTSVQPRPVGSVGIIGAGLMGSSIAAAHVRRGLPVVIHDLRQEALSAAAISIAAELRETGGGSTTASFDRLVRPTGDLAEAACCDLVLESIVERLPAKRRLFEQLQPLLAQNALLASNTSTIPVEQLVQGFGSPARFCVMHFCHPVRQRPLVEIAAGPQTADATIAAAAAHARRIGKMPLIVPDGPGFVVNRLLFPYLGAGLQLLGEGATAESIDRAATEFGMAVGPLRMIDEIGLDTALQAAWTLSAAFPDRIASSPRLVSMIKAGRLGRKTGAGFFSYDAPQSSPDVAEGDSPRERLPHRAAESQPMPDHLPYRLLLPMLLEATRIVEEGKACDVRDIDLAVLFGLGFPAAKGGLLWWADALGAERIVALLDSPGMDAKPTPMLRAMAKTDGKFYG